ncbi:MAG TPA: hypothetical protein VFN04_07570, partial [Protaetiibacter sp.]|nr:hypothetical protein [Protaetiibacter sp.]
PSYDRVERVFSHLRRTLAQLFPAVGDAEVTHRWGGPLGVPRDWHAAVRYDPATRIGWAGGYVGDGLSTTNLAGRTLAELLTGATVNSPGCRGWGTAHRTGRSSRCVSSARTPDSPP